MQKGGGRTKILIRSSTVTKVSCLAALENTIVNSGRYQTDLGESKR